MNLFILDRMPVTAARYYCDKHVEKIILEAVEMMGYAYDPGEFILPRVKSFKSHENQPMARWVRGSKQNFDWTYAHTEALCEEHFFRYDKPHSYMSHVKWIGSNMPVDNLSNFGQTDWPRCFGDWSDVIETTNDAVQDYRRYYMVAKRFATWKKRQMPYWFV